MTITTDAEDAGRKLGSSLAVRVRELRGEQNLSLDALAQRAGLSKGTVVSLEQGKANPSIGVLCRLAAAFSLSVTDLLAKPLPNGRDQPIEKTVPVTLWSTSNGSRAQLDAAIAGRTMFELWSWTLVPGDAFAANAHSPGTRELVSVASGSLLVTVGDLSMTLNAGEAVRLLTDQPHSYACAVDNPVSFTMSVLERGSDI
jgi:transcriptional regulator with XRE-family HTH domain